MAYAHRYIVDFVKQQLQLCSGNDKLQYLRYVASRRAGTMHSDAHHTMYLFFANSVIVFKRVSQ